MIFCTEVEWGGSERSSRKQIGYFYSPIGRRAGFIRWC